MPKGVYPHKRTPPEDRFWSRVDKRGPDECWEWQGQRTRGYGSVGKSEGGGILAHRFAYEQSVGPIPAGLELDHLCRNPPCVNPAHLEPVTHAENMARGQNAARTHCPQGHPYDQANTYVGKNGGRHCRECHRLAEVARKRALGVRERRPDHCMAGHEFTDENTYIRPDGQGRMCRTCQRDRKKSAA